MKADVVVVGGGPAGSVCASRLAQRGISSLVLEKEKFPRFRLGESLLPNSLPILEEIGVLAEVERTFIHKFGARFHDDITGRKDRFSFDGAWRGELDHAFQVPRDAFDTMLLGHARKLGADVREQWSVSRIVRDGERATGVDVVGPNGESERVEARFVVDATGRTALSAHASRATTKIDGLDQTAIFSHFEGVPRAPGKLAGDIDIILFRDAADARANWFWVIPFVDGRTSVGAVVGSAWMRERRVRLPRDIKPADTVTALFDMAVAESSTATDMLASARRQWPCAQATADFSYRVRDIFGDGWLSIGDAAGFIDPLFSTGVHLAMSGGKRAADAIAEELASAGAPGDALRVWERDLRAAAETFIVAVRSFYRGPLVDYLFAENKHTALRRSITSLLAGDVFGDAVWLRDTRRRLAELAGEDDLGT